MSYLQVVAKEVGGECEMGDSSVRGLSCASHFALYVQIIHRSGRNFMTFMKPLEERICKLDNHKIHFLFVLLMEMNIFPRDCVFRLLLPL